MLLLASPAQHADAQQTYMHVGADRSELLYTNSQGDKLEGMHPGTGLTLAAGLRRPFRSLVSKWHYTAGLIYERYGMRGTGPAPYRDYLEWRTDYLGADLGVERDLITLGQGGKGSNGPTVFARAAAAPQFLVKGAQTIGSEVYDLRGVEQFDAPLLFLRAGAGLNYCVSNRTAIVVDYLFAHGMRLPGVPWPDDERLAFRTHTLRVGIMISSANCRYCLARL
ncbi:MAG: hypothetical protein RBT71_03145 [Flavobacteriales bacterium]|nr:hypothetical protein [Flavobacteriales bacterium]